MSNCCFRNPPTNMFLVATWHFLSCTWIILKVKHDVKVVGEKNIKILSAGILHKTHFLVLKWSPLISSSAAFGFHSVQADYCTEWYYLLLLSTKTYKQGERENPLRLHSPPIILDRSRRIPQSTHLVQLCCQDVMSRGNISFNYSYFNSIYTSAARSLLSTAILCSWEFTGEIYFFCSPLSTQSPLCSQTLPGPIHLI